MPFLPLLNLLTHHPFIGFIVFVLLHFSLRTPLFGKSKSRCLQFPSGHFSLHVPMVDNGGGREKTSGMVGALPLLPTELSFRRCRAQAKKKSVASLSLRLVENPIAS